MIGAPSRSRRLWGVVLLAGLALVAPTPSTAAATRVWVPIVPREAPPTATPTSTPVPTATPIPTATPSPTPTRTPVPGPRVRITSSSSRPSSSYQYVYARVLNEGTAPAFDARVTVTFFNADGSIAGADYGYAHLSMVRPGESATARLIAQPQATWTRYELAVAWSDHTYTTYVHDGLVVSAINTYRTGSTVYVVGLVTNQTGRTVRFITVDVGLDRPSGAVEAGGIVDANYTYPFSSTDAAPGASTSFSVSFYDPDGHIPPGYTSTILAEGWVS